MHLFPQAASEPPALTSHHYAITLVVLHHPRRDHTHWLTAWWWKECLTFSYISTDLRASKQASLPHLLSSSVSQNKKFSLWPGKMQGCGRKRLKSEGFYHLHCSVNVMSSCNTVYEAEFPCLVNNSFPQEGAICKQVSSSLPISLLMAKCQQV